MVLQYLIILTRLIRLSKYYSCICKSCVIKIRLESLHIYDTLYNIQKHNVRSHPRVTFQINNDITHSLTHSLNQSSMHHQLPEAATRDFQLSTRGAVSMIRHLLFRSFRENRLNFSFGWSFFPFSLGCPSKLRTTMGSEFEGMRRT